MPKKQDAINALKKVKDPEIDMDIYTLGLVYNIEPKADTVKITMTLTSPTCPFGPVIIEDCKKNLKRVGFKRPTIDVVFEPLWQPSEDVKLMLGVA